MFQLVGRCIRGRKREENDGVREGGKVRCGVVSPASSALAVCSNWETRDKAGGGGCRHWRVGCC